MQNFLGVIFTFNDVLLPYVPAQFNHSLPNEIDASRYEIF